MMRDPLELASVTPFDAFILAKYGLPIPEPANECERNGTCMEDPECRFYAEDKMTR